MSEDFESLELIGRGSFGQIRKVRRRADGQVLVRKEISYKSMNQKEKAQLIAEFRILKSLVHPNIVQYLHHEHISEQHVVHLYMEYCGGGDLAGLIRQCRESNEYVPENVVWSIFTQLILALYRCHFNTDPPPPGDLFCLDSSDVNTPMTPSTVILHRDIKPDNVFLDKNHSVKLGDFGLAKMLDQEHIMANTYVGTPFYMSPEVLMDQPYTPQSDIWSLGCVIYELCALHPPFQAKSHLLLSQKIREGTYPGIPDCYSSTLGRTIAACININALQRPTTATLLSLDVIKLCRKEKEITEARSSLASIEEELQRREQLLIEREQQLVQDFEAHKQELEQEVYNKLERELSTAIEREVDRRVEIVMKEQKNLFRPPGGGGPTSPSDTSMNSPASPPLSSRNVKGPRSIRDNIISPLRASRQPFDDMTNHQFIPSSPSAAFNSRQPATTASYSHTETNHQPHNIVTIDSGSDASSTSSNETTESSNATSIGPGSDYTSNWQTKKVGTPQRSAPHYNIVPTGIGAAAAKAKIMGVKGTPGSIGRTAVQIQRENNTTSDNNSGKMWDETLHGDDMPSPFLKRWERRLELKNRSL
jgi:serine/threonine protein kinase